jgi:hypothetical protein
VRNEISLKWKAVAVALFACVALFGCGGDDSDETEAGAGGSGGGGAGGTTGGSSGTAGDGGDGGAGNGGSGGTGGGGTGGAGGGFEIMCTEDPPTTPVTCGSTECPMPPLMGGMDTCQRPCCVADECGVKSTLQQLPTECAVPAEPDPRCPDVDSMLGALEGCCTADNECGIISALRGNACITESMLIELPAMPQACDAVDGDDAGVP